MSYIGQPPFQEFANPPTKDSFTGDGSTTTFDMNAEVPIASENALEVYIDNVRQEPGSGKAFTLGPDGSGDQKRLTFSAAPANGASIYVINDKTNVQTTAPLAQDLNGTELILDANADTSITADTDDRIDFLIGGTDHFHITSSSGDTVFQNRTDAKDFKFNQYDGRTILEVNDAGYVALGNGSTSAGELRIYEDTDNGSNYSAFTVGTQSGDVTYTLPTADGSSGQGLVTNGSGTLSWSTLSANTPSSADGQALGSTSLEWSDLYLADGGIIYLGADQDTTLTHVADTGILLNSTRQLQFGDSGTYIHQSADGVLDLVADTEIEINATTIDMNGALDVSGTITSGGVITGTAFTAGSAVLTEAELETLDGITAGTVIASKAIITDANIDITGGRNITISGELDAATLDISGNADIDGTTNLDEVDIDGTVQIDGATTFGVDDTGVDVKFFGATSGSYLLWDESQNKLATAGGTVIDIVKDKLMIASTAVTTTAAELNILDGDTSASAVTVADADRVILNDGGTMKQVAMTDLSAYFDDEVTALPNVTSLGTLTTLTVDNVIINGSTIGHTGDTDLMTVASGVLTVAGEVSMTTLDIGGTNVTTTAAELNLIDGGTSRGTTAVATGDGILINDGGTMRMTNVDTVSTYFSSHNVGGGNIVTTGALDSGSITSGFGAIDNGTSNIRSATITAETAFVPDANDGADIGTTSLGFNDLFLADAGTIQFGNDQDIRLIHNADKGLIIKHIATADDKPVILTLQTGETDMAANDVMGKIEFQAPDEGTGTDAILVSAAIQARAEGDFSSSSNATSLEFMTGSSEAAAAKMTINSDGEVGIGTTDPTSKLHISDNSNYSLKVVKSGSNIHAAQFASNGTAALGIAVDESNNQVRLNSEGSNDSLILEVADGTDAIVIDSAGHVTMPLQPAFHRHETSSDQTISSTDPVTVTYNTERFDNNSDMTTNTFTAPVTGKYLFTMGMTLEDFADDYIVVHLDTSNLNHTFHPISSGNLSETYKALTASIIVDMDVNDTAIVTVNSANDSSYKVRAGRYFTGALIC